VLDTGIRFSHQEFRSQAGGGVVRARHGFSVFGDGDSSDCNGHGTHTAGIIAAVGNNM
jgi:serine protease